MEALERIANWFQVTASVLFVCVSAYMMTCTLLRGLSAVYIVCFGAILILSAALLHLSIHEFRTSKNNPL